MKYISNKNEIPKDPHYAIILFGSIYIDGDERSRTHPGHGYPAHSENKIDYWLEDNGYWKTVKSVTIKL